jgi:hypothetical protein
VKTIVIIQNGLLYGIKYLELLEMKRRQIHIQKKNKYQKEQEKMFSQIKVIKPLLEKHKIISLGFNCFIKIFLNKMKIEQETQFFDWIGSSTWSIRLLLENHFDDLLQKENLQYLQTIQKENEYVWTDQLYYLRFKHDFQQTHFKKTRQITNQEWKDVKEKYERRRERFFQTLQEYEKNKKILLFIRLQEDFDQRIYPEIHKNIEKEDEIKDLLWISNWIQNQYPNLLFKIILISQNKNQHSYIHESDSHLAILHTSNINTNYDVPMIVHVLHENKEFIGNILK